MTLHETTYLFSPFFFTHYATPKIYTLSYTTLFRSVNLAIDIYAPDVLGKPAGRKFADHPGVDPGYDQFLGMLDVHYFDTRSEEHTSELQSLRQLICRLLLVEKTVSDLSDTLHTLTF